MSIVRLRLFAGALAILASGACAQTAPTPTASAPPTATQPSSVTVTLGIYSGRPDPSWALSEAQIAEVDSLLRSLPTATGEPPQGGLGYRGFVLEIAEPGQALRSLFAFRGAIASLVPGPGTYWQDPARTVEVYLLETGRPHLAANEIDAVEADLGRTE